MISADSDSELVSKDAWGEIDGRHGDGMGYCGETFGLEALFVCLDQFPYLDGLVPTSGSEDSSRIARSPASAQDHPRMAFGVPARQDIYLWSGGIAFEDGPLTISAYAQEVFIVVGEP